MMFYEGVQAEIGDQEFSDSATEEVNQSSDSTISLRLNRARWPAQSDSKRRLLRVNPNRVLRENSAYDWSRVKRQLSREGMNFFLYDLLRHASGVQGDDGVYPARPNALYTPTGPLGRSVASVDLKQPSMHRTSVFGLSAPMCSQPSQEQFFLSRVSLLRAADVSRNIISRIRTATPPGEGDGPGGVAGRSICDGVLC
ncbi:hypothetical protein THAOC_10628 [Thalassiosira oceanica]|uniref:Uncharacterized protein n=1 Tax=Thalassiosira oceanica TaxID=159749 RepID=K0STD6_THAOC|nr:hypothetical protein THAOC_10628 [Thalassiosira oceanica]|eukprot:EJK68214.1 hypothetical protein THAOC_10628 [Thalassiosira oceanica]